MVSPGSPGDVDSALLNGGTELQCAQELLALGVKSVACLSPPVPAHLQSTADPLGTVHPFLQRPITLPQSL